ncbi:hypothetical protein DPMN_133806 [Dreissena polymorpha]|uniref:Uncharacterized protein n=1 Tax=Dreissena polymorpha TaxID=45954 RepID=A0A9D4G0U6_DREPO|nr:hypothetical protein DPMN_133806 [Dreissena polymorpha]
MFIETVPRKFRLKSQQPCWKKISCGGTESIAEKRAIHLIAEETNLDVTGDMIDEVIREQYHMYRMLRNITDTMLISEAEAEVIGNVIPMLISEAEVIGNVIPMLISEAEVIDNVISILICEAEYGATGKQNPHEPGDRAYNMITKGYFSIKENRNSHRDDIWGHSQYAMNKVKKRKITRKAGGEEVVEEVQEPEDEEE